MVIPFFGLPVLLHLTETHLTGMFYLLTAVSVCELEEIFLALHTCVLSTKVTGSLSYVIFP